MALRPNLGRSSTRSGPSISHQHRLERCWMLNTFNSTTQYIVMPPPDTMLCRHPIHWNPATGRLAVSTVSSPPEAGRLLLNQ